MSQPAQSLSRLSSAERLLRQERAAEARAQTVAAILLLASRPRTARDPRSRFLV